MLNHSPRKTAQIHVQADSGLHPLIQDRFFELENTSPLARSRVAKHLNRGKFGSEVDVPYF
jgi:hypothetical protein